MQTHLLLVSAVILSSGYVMSSAVKRQGLFSCSGWGASCMSGWTGWRRSKGPKPKAVQLVPVDHKVVSRPGNKVTKFWLTTEKTWGPMGKRGNTDSSSLIINALMDHFKTRQHRKPEYLMAVNYPGLPYTNEDQLDFILPSQM